MTLPNKNTDLGVGNVDIVYAIENLGSALTSSVTIATNSRTSTFFDMSTKTISGFGFPAGYEGGNVTFEGSNASDGTYTDIYDSNGNQVSATVATGSRIVSMVGNSLQALANVPYIKVKSSATVSAIRTITVLTKG